MNTASQRRSNLDRDKLLCPAQKVGAQPMTRVARPDSDAATANAQTPEKPRPPLDVILPPNERAMEGHSGS